jgi:hypothetical protein
MDTCEHLVTGDPCTCLSLPRLTSSCLDFNTAHVRRRLACASADKFKFNYLNGNLVVPEIHPFSLSFDFNSDTRKAPDPTFLQMDNRFGAEQGQWVCQQND